MAAAISARFVLVAAATGLAPAGAAADDCVVNGKSVILEQVRVQPAGGGDPLELDVREVPIKATIRPDGLVDLDIGGAISFKATATTVWWTLAKAAETADKLVSLSAGAHLVHVRSGGDAVTGDAVVHAADVMPGEAKEPDESVGPIRVACAKLTLDWELGTDLDTRGDGSNWRPKKRPNQITLRAAPNAKATAITYIAPSCEGAGCINVERVSSRGSWLLVAAANEGVRLAGWVRRSELARVPDSVMVGHSYGCTGDHGRNQTFGGSSSQVGLVEGPAKIRIGTTIYAEHGTGAWATVVVDGPYRVRFVRGEAWAELLDIPGVDGAGAEAYVPISAVTQVRED